MELNRDLNEIIDDIRIEEDNIIIEFNYIEPNLYLSTSMENQEILLNNVNYKYDYILYDKNEGHIKIHDIVIPIKKISNENIEEIDYYKWNELPMCIQANILKVVDIYEIIDSIEEYIIEAYEGETTYNMMVEDGWFEDDF